MQRRNTLSLNSILSRLANNQRTKDAITLFLCMTRGCSYTGPDNFTYAIVLPLCDHNTGRQIHARMLKVCSSPDVPLGTNLVRMYGEMGDIEDARRYFDEMPERDLVSWNALVSCYSKRGRGEICLQLFQHIMKDGIRWDEFTISTVANELASRGHVFGGMQVHSLAVRSGLCFDRFTTNALVNLYSKCGHVKSAAQMLSEIPGADVVSWTSLIVGLGHSGYGTEAIRIFNQMRVSDLRPNSFTFGGLISTCANRNAFDNGKQYHGLVLKFGLESDVVVGSAIVNMYSKCGEMSNARQLFETMPKRDLVSWNGMICGLAQNGEAEQALNLFQEMVRRGEGGIVPNHVTFLGVLSACSYAGLVHRGRQLFNEMLHVYMIRPSAEHYTCMVDLLARAGLLEEAEAFVLSSPLKPNSAMWTSLLGACRRYGNLVMAKRIAARLVLDEPGISSSYVLLANVFAGRSEWGGAGEARIAMEGAGAHKVMGWSWIEVKGCINSFGAGENHDHLTLEIYTMLQGLCSQMGEEGQDHRFHWAVA